MKKILCFIVSIMISASAFAAFTVNADTHSGACGEAAFWEFDDTSGILTISGSGAMADFQNSEFIPWKDYIKEIKAAVISGDVSSVGNYAFSWCEALEKVSFCETVSKIGIHAFEFCPSLKSIELPKNITAIEHYTFWCSGLEEICIPEGVTSVGYFSFQGCEKLKKLVMPSTLNFIDGLAFFGCDALGDVYFRGSKAAFEKVGIGSLNSVLDKTVCHDEAHLYNSPCDADCDVCGYIRKAIHSYDDLYDNVCNICGYEKCYIKGDINGDGKVDSDDAIYLLYYIFFSDDYYIEQPCDFDTNSAINSDDAIYLLYHIFFPEDYPIR